MTIDGKNGKDKNEEISTDELNTDYDVVDELKTSLNDLYNMLQEANMEEHLEKVSYLRFLARKIDDSLTGEYKKLRIKRFAAKK